MKKHLKLIKTIFAAICAIYGISVFLTIYFVRGNHDMLFVYSGI